MKRKKRRFLYTVAVIIIVIVALHVASRLLLRPNVLDIEDTHPFILKTTWHQTGDYARHVTYDNDVGCWATAIGQISHHHQLDPSGTIEYETSEGYAISEDFDDYLFNHEQFPNAIDAQTPETSKEQVAKYLYCIAALIYTDFGSSGYLEHETMVSRIEGHLDCSVDFHEYQKQSYSSAQDEIKELIKNEIDAQRPLMFYFDNGKDFGHAAALDGYIEQGDRFFVHLNMGWGGHYDGWYDPFKKIIGARDDLQNRFIMTFKPNEMQMF